MKAIYILVHVWHLLAFILYEGKRKRSETKITDKFKEGLRLRKKY